MQNFEIYIDGKENVIVGINGSPSIPAEDDGADTPETIQDDLTWNVFNSLCTKVGLYRSYYSGTWN